MEQLARNERWLITENEVGLRLDLWLVEKLAFSRSQIKNLISEGKVLVNGQSVKAGHSLKLSDEVVVSLPTPVSEKPLPENLPLDVIYEDDDLLIVNKPVDVVVHPGAGNLSGTLVNAFYFITQKFISDHWTRATRHCASFG